MPSRRPLQILVRPIRMKGGALGFQLGYDLSRSFDRQMLAN